MPQSKILLDTNAYLRLAQSIRPLLGVPFGKKQYTLYIHRRFEEEFGKSHRLKTKFYWAKAQEYIDNRKKRLQLSQQDKNEIEHTYEFIWVFQHEQEFGLSRIDIYCIATALQLGIPLVTDDEKMIQTCKEFDVVVYSTIQLLKLMLDEKFISVDKIKQITEYWKYEKDLPKNFNIDIEKNFGDIFMDY